MLVQNRYIFLNTTPKGLPVVNGAPWTEIRRSLEKKIKKTKTRKRSNTLKTKKKSYKLTDRKYYLRRKENQANRQLQGWWGLWGVAVRGVGGWHGGGGGEAVQSTIS